MRRHLESNSHKSSLLKHLILIYGEILDIAIRMMCKADSLHNHLIAVIRNLILDSPSSAKNRKYLQQESGFHGRQFRDELSAELRD